jgi:hypothetical protein
MPYLSDNDTNPAVNYVATPIKTQQLRNESYFTFDDLGFYPDGFDNATLYFEAKKAGMADSFDVYGGPNSTRYCLADIYVDSSTYHCYSADVSEFIRHDNGVNIRTDINNFRIALVYGLGPEEPQEQGMEPLTSSVIYVTYCELRVYVNIQTKDVWHIVTAVQASGKMYECHFENDWNPFARVYWSALAVVDTDNNGNLYNLAEMGLAISYSYDIFGNWWARSYYAYFTYIDANGTAVEDDYMLDTSTIGDTWYYFFLNQTDPYTWRGGVQIGNSGNWHWFNAHTYIQAWAGILLSSIESYKQPLSGQAGHPASDWWQITVADFNHNWQAWVPDWKCNDPNFSMSCWYPDGVHNSNSWFSYVEYH